jgi:cytochrome c-type biogenesis protein CcmH
MSTFVIIASLMALATVSLLLLPLLRKSGVSKTRNSAALSVEVLRDQLNDLETEKQAGRLDEETFVQEKADLERRALEDGTIEQANATGAAAGRLPRLGVALVVLVPLLSVGIYWLKGSPDALTGKSQTAAPDGANHAVTPEQIQAMVAKLAQRLQDNPNDGEGWLMLARSYGALGRFPESAAAFGRASGLLPPNANILADYADTLAMAQGKKLAGDPERIIAQALAVDPQNVKALALAGSAAFERQDYAVAISEWKKIVAIVPPDSNVARSISNSIADAESRSGRVSAMPAVAAAKPPVAGAASVSGQVSLSPALQGKVGEGDVLFIFARALDGSRIPLAMLRKKAAELPVAFTLNDEMAMAPGAKLSAHRQVMIGARVSKGGDAIAKPGDLEGFSAEVAVGGKDVRIVIDRVVQ